MEGSQWDAVDKSRLQVPAKGCGVVGPKPYILVEVKCIDTGPVDSGLGDERVEDFELTRSCGDDDPSVTLLGDGAAKDHRSELGGISSHAGAVGLNDDIDDGTWG
jgi:hypothetical protein